MPHCLRAWLGPPTPLGEEVFETQNRSPIALQVKRYHQPVKEFESQRDGEGSEKAVCCQGAKKVKSTQRPHQGQMAVAAADSAPCAETAGKPAETANVKVHPWESTSR